MAEPNAFPNTTLRWVQASAPGVVETNGAIVNGYTAWNTASAPQSGIIGFVQSYNVNSGANLQSVNHKSIPLYHSKAASQPVTLQVDFFWTGEKPEASAYNASVGMFMMELWNQHAGGTAVLQFFGVAENGITWSDSEGNPAASVSMTLNALGMLTTASGYLG